MSKRHSSVRQQEVPDKEIMQANVVKTVKQLQQMKYALVIRTAPLDSNIFADSSSGVGNAKLTPSFSAKDMNNRNTSADTDDTKSDPNSQNGNRRVSNKFQIGAPSNYDKIKSMREQKVKDKNVTKLYQSPDPVCNLT